MGHLGWLYKLNLHPRHQHCTDEAQKAETVLSAVRYIYILRKKGRNYISRQACFVNRFTLQGFKPLKSEAIHETGLSGNVVASFFPLKIFIPLYFNVLSTVPRESRLTDSLYIYIYIYIYNFFFVGILSFENAPLYRDF